MIVIRFIMYINIYFKIEHDRIYFTALRIGVTLYYFGNIEFIDTR